MSTFVRLIADVEANPSPKAFSVRVHYSPIACHTVQPTSDVDWALQRGQERTRLAILAGYDSSQSVCVCGPKETSPLVPRSRPSDGRAADYFNSEPSVTMRSHLADCRLGAVPNPNPLTGCCLGAVPNPIPLADYQLGAVPKLISTPTTSHHLAGEDDRTFTFHSNTDVMADVDTNFTFHFTSDETPFTFHSVLNQT